jgi:hypothetical protein
MGLIELINFLSKKGPKVTAGILSFLSGKVLETKYQITKEQKQNLGNKYKEIENEICIPENLVKTFNKYWNNPELIVKKIKKNSDLLRNIHSGILITEAIIVIISGLHIYITFSIIQTSDQLVNQFNTIDLAEILLLVDQGLFWSSIQETTRINARLKLNLLYYNHIRKLTISVAKQQGRLEQADQYRWIMLGINLLGCTISISTFSGWSTFSGVRKLFVSGLSGLLFVESGIQMYQFPKLSELIEKMENIMIVLNDISIIVINTITPNENSKEEVSKIYMKIISYT